MVFWSVALAALLIAVAWGGANWRMFHLAYCRHLLGSRDPATRQRGIDMVLQTHVRPGMTWEEILRLFGPRGLSCGEFSGEPKCRVIADFAGNKHFWLLGFAEDGRLDSCAFCLNYDGWGPVVE